MIEVASWTWTMALAIILLLLILIYQSWSYYHGAGFSGIWARRSLYYLVGLAGIALLILRPVMNIEQPSYAAGLITSYANQEVIEQFKQARPQVVIYDNIDAYFANAERGLVDSLHVFGLGLSPDEAPLFTEEELVFYKPKLDDGLLEINIPNVEEQVPFLISGKVDTTINALQIINPLGATTDVTIGDAGVFNKEVEGMAAGRYLYKIITISAERDTYDIEVPIVVEDAKKYSSLILLKSPSFESNYFKNYWSQLGHSYAQRIQIAENRFTQTFINRSKTDLTQIGSSSLRGVDFVMADVDSWNNLTIAEQRRIKRKVSSDGTTLLLMTNDGATADDIPSIAFSRSKKVEFTTYNQSVEMNGVVKSNGAWRRVIHNGIHVAYKRQYGIGQIGYLPVEDSYKLLLNDMSMEYQQYWSELLSAFYIDTDVPYVIDLPEYIWEDELTPLTIHSSTSISAPVMHNDSLIRRWINNPLITNSYKIEIIPNEGWNKISFGDEQPYYFYAYPNEVFGNRHHQRNIKASISYTPPKNIKALPSKSKPVSRWWGYGLALIGFGLLWFEERMLG